MRVKKVGAVEQTDTSVYLCVVKRYGFHGFSLQFTGLAYIMIASLFGQPICFRIFMAVLIRKTVSPSQVHCMLLTIMTVIR